MEQEQRTEPAEFQVLKDQDGRYYWRLQAANHKIIAWSGQAYDSKYWCVQDVNWLRANAHLIMAYDYTGEPLHDGHTPTGAAASLTTHFPVSGALLLRVSPHAARRGACLDGPGSRRPGQ